LHFGIEVQLSALRKVPRIAVAVMGLEIDPSLKSVAEVAGTKFSRSAIPKLCDQTSSPSCTTATEIPGTLFAAMKLEAAFSTPP